MICRLILAVLLVTVSNSAWAQFGPPSEAPVQPDCAVTYLYSVGQVHYYETVACSDPSITGYGTSGGTHPITPNGCDGLSCTPGSTVVPTKQPGPSVSAKNCNCGKNRFQIQSSRGARIAIRRAMAVPAGSPRKVVADLTAAEFKKPAFLRALDGDDGLLLKVKAQFYVDRVSGFLNTARVASVDQAGNETTKHFAVRNRDLGIDTLRNLEADNSEVDIDDLFRTPSGSTTTGGDAVLRRIGDSSTAYKYIRIGNAGLGLDSVFRLQKVTIPGATTEVHFVGQQIRKRHLPAGADVLDGPPNVRVIDNHEHVHVIQVRVHHGGGMLSAVNSRKFLCYSSANLSDGP